MIKTVLNRRIRVTQRGNRQSGSPPGWLSEGMPGDKGGLIVVIVMAVVEHCNNWPSGNYLSFLSLSNDTGVSFLLTQNTFYRFIGGCKAEYAGNRGQTAQRGFGYPAVARSLSGIADSAAISASGLRLCNARLTANGVSQSSAVLRPVSVENARLALLRLGYGIQNFATKAYVGRAPSYAIACVANGEKLLEKIEQQCNLPVSAATNANIREDMSGGKRGGGFALAGGAALGGIEQAAGKARGARIAQERLVADAVMPVRREPEFDMRHAFGHAFRHAE